MTSILLIVLLVLVFFQGAVSEHILGISWITAGVPDSPISRLLVEAAVLINALWLFGTRKVRRPPGMFWFVLYILWVLLSGMLVNHDLIESLLYARYTVYGLLVYLVSWNLGLTPRQLTMLNRTVVSLAVLQIAVSLFRILVLNDRTEWRVGTMILGGGEMAAEFPLLALSFAMGWYFYVRRSLGILLLGLSFGIIGYASGKRAIYFSIPIFFLLNTMIYLFLEHRRAAALFVRKFFPHAVLASVIVTPAMLFGIANSQGVGSDQSGVVDIAVHAFQYAMQYDDYVTEEGKASGRSSASARVRQELGSASVSDLVLGHGPNALTLKGGNTYDGTGFMPLGILYGIVGWSRDALSVGVIGMLLYILAHVRTAGAALKTLRSRTSDPRQKALAFGAVSGFVALLYTYFFYGTGLMTTGCFTFLLFLYSAVASSPYAVRQKRRNAATNSYIPVPLPWVGSLPLRHETPRY